MAENPFYDIAIIGGGAAGLAASVFIARQSQGKYTPAVFEKAPRVGRKLLATGNGTCNLSNYNVSKQRYHGKDPSFAEPALAAYPPEKVCEFFHSIGVECIQRDNGRIYPLCEQAGAVLDCLRLEMQALGIREICTSPILKAVKDNHDFLIFTDKERIRARHVLICTGGAASPALGGSAESYSLLTSLGHMRTPLFPSIVQVKTDTQFVKAVKGVRVDAAIAFYLDGRKLAEEKGEILFTEYGLSGPAVMQISRCVSDWERRHQGNMTAVLNLLPKMDADALRTSLKDRLVMKSRTLNDYMTGLLQKRLGQTVLRTAGFISLSEPVTILTENDIAKIAYQITHWEIPVVGTQGMGGAQVTAGGISSTEFNAQTMESKLVPGIYAAGEVLDIDGDCGGFNLQWAWASAYLAAQSIVNSLEKEFK